MRLLLLWLINSASLITVAYLLPSVRVESFGAAFMAALMLGLVNTFIRPVMVLLTLPTTLLTLGLFIFVINGLMLLLTSSLSDALGLGFHVRGFWDAFWGALVVSIVSMLLSIFISEPSRSRD